MEYPGHRAGRFEARAAPMIIGVGSSAVAAAGSFMPWVRAGILTVNGTDGDGALTFVLGAVSACLFLLWALSGLRSWLVLFLTAGLGALVLLVVIVDGTNMQRLSSELEGSVFEPQIGVGIYVTGAGGAGTILASLIGVRR